MECSLARRNSDWPVGLAFYEMLHDSNLHIKESVDDAIVQRGASQMEDWYRARNFVAVTSRETAGFPRDEAILISN
jgi:hypothetical protein